MKTATDTSSAEFFEAKYQAAEDPWDFAGSEYELRRYDAILDALAGKRYSEAFEPGCSVGVLTERLAGICDAVEAIDFSATAVTHAKQRCEHLKNVRILCSSLPDRLPLVGFDLVVLSEIGYYFDREAWSVLVNAMLEGLSPGATVLGEHWLGTSPDHVLSGDVVHEVLRSNAGLRLEHEERHNGFRLDRWVRT